EASVNGGREAHLPWPAPLDLPDDRLRNDRGRPYECPSFPETKASLGEPVYLGGGLASSLRHASDWLSFLALRHFWERDVLLSDPGVLQLAIGVLLVGALLGAWSLPLA